MARPSGRRRKSSNETERLPGVANATPAGMKAGDPLPVDVTKLPPTSFVGCVITAPAVSPLIEAARRLGCKTSTGTEMYNALQASMVDFLLAADARA